MFEKCIPCTKKGVSCVPNLWLLPLPELMQWCIKEQKYLGWSNQRWADESKVPIGTINRLKAGEYADCKYSTIRSLALSLIGGTTDEFSCTEQVEKELQQIDQLERQAARMDAVERENEELKCHLKECQELNAFLMDELKAWRSLHQDHR